MNNFYNILNIESRFKEITGLDSTIDLSIFPITEHIPFTTRNSNKKTHGEVFTPVEIVDKMLLISNPDPNKFNMDLCAGRGQFTIRMLRKFINENKKFDIEYYLKNLHWFNELNQTSVDELIYIFGDKINCANGPAQELQSYPIDENKNWVKGIIKWNGKNWDNKEVDKTINQFFDIS